MDDDQQLLYLLHMALSSTRRKYFGRLSVKDNSLFLDSVYPEDEQSATLLDLFYIILKRFKDRSEIETCVNNYKVYVSEFEPGKFVFETGPGFVSGGSVATNTDGRRSPAGGAGGVV